MAKSNYLENKVIDHFLGTSSTSAPSNVYLALFTSDPTDAGSGTELTIGSNGYTRNAITLILLQVDLLQTVRKRHLQLVVATGEQLPILEYLIIN